ncbi:hypothetical protein AC1031_018528 [Aphanomyces cochlioides]|nr:hypothetical protein AC1031_018528 [Aphanomyces cochlioides]
MNLTFSGSGFLLAFHIGVANYFRRQGYISATSRFAGASGGSLVAASLAYDVPMANVLDETKNTARAIHEDLKKKKMFNLSSYVNKHIGALFPEDLPIHDFPRLVITTTQVWPRVRIVHWTDFPNKNFLTDRMLLSCHVPWYFDGTPARLIDGKEWHADGGLLCFVPEVEDHVKVSIIPMPWDRKTISPALIPNFPISSARLLQWALLPPSNEMLDKIVSWGEEAAEIWDVSRSQGDSVAA